MVTAAGDGAPADPADGADPADAAGIEPLASPGALGVVEVVSGEPEGTAAERDERGRDSGTALVGRPCRTVAWSDPPPHAEASTASTTAVSASRRVLRVAVVTSGAG